VKEDLRKKTIFLSTISCDREYGWNKSRRKRSPQRRPKNLHRYPLGERWYSTEGKEGHGKGEKVSRFLTRGKSPRLKRRSTGVEGEVPGTIEKAGFSWFGKRRISIYFRGRETIHRREVRKHKNDGWGEASAGGEIVFFLETYYQVSNLPE